MPSGATGIGAVDAALAAFDASYAALLAAIRETMTATSPPPRVSVDDAMVAASHFNSFKFQIAQAREFVAAIGQIYKGKT